MYYRKPKLSISLSNHHNNWLILINQHIQRTHYHPILQNPSFLNKNHPNYQKLNHQKSNKNQLNNKKLKLKIKENCIKKNIILKINLAIRRLLISIFGRKSKIKYSFNKLKKINNYNRIKYFVKFVSNQESTV